MTRLNDTLARVTDRIRERSQATRSAYLARLDSAASQHPTRAKLGCTNLAHGVAACSTHDKSALANTQRGANIALVSAYNDMLSAHQPYESYPALIKQAIRDTGGVAQFAGGVPAMCDGITQGDAGMELSLFSRDVIAMSTAIALSHNMFDGMLLLGICDKIVPGLLMGALAFGHLPAIFVPGGPMPSGISNAEKAKIRQLHAEGKVDNTALLDSEMRSYHSAGTCTFYGTANSNQMLMEIMGLHMPNAAFYNPNTPIRDALTVAAAKRITEITRLGDHPVAVGRMIDERAIVNAIIGLHATGGSTNHTLHIVAIARTAGLIVNWTDFSELSDVIPLLARVYPNGSADVNQFHAAGGMAFVIRELLRAGLLHADVQTVAGQGLEHYTQVPVLENSGTLHWVNSPSSSGDTSILRPATEPFSATGGLKLLEGNIGRAVIKTSAVKPENRVVEAPAIVFNSQEEALAAFKRGELNKDFVAVLRFQGPRANGMPELHKLTPALGVLQDKGYKVALVTDGRMSGASGKVPAAIHITPECLAGGDIGKIRNGDVILVDGESGQLIAKVDTTEWQQRNIATADLDNNSYGMGRELFAGARQNAAGAEQGGLTLCLPA
jgi:phosphogluconate dehydratase